MTMESRSIRKSRCNDAEQAKKYSEEHKAQKEADIKRLEEEYEAKTAEFKKTMRDSI